jgi:hypothetical protein
VDELQFAQERTDKLIIGVDPQLIDPKLDLDATSL